MADQPLFYRDIVPLNRDTHRQLRLPGTLNASFAAKSHLVPAVVDEFASAARFLPIFFSPTESMPTPVFLAGVRSGENVFVSSDGTWQAGYAPAYLRRYPFIFGEVEGRDPLICVDNAFEGLSAEHGEPVFDEEGRETPMLLERIRLVTDFMTAGQRTKRMMETLTALGLFRSVSIDLKSPAGDSASLHGLLTVDEPKLAEVPDEALLRLRREGLLGPIYAHLLSLRSVDALNVTQGTP